ncbi:hypothetical protein AWENTII_000484 [Aspergillus wentii]|nr:hypothetical protein MW887_005190 [Aspergillus wentii]
MFRTSLRSVTGPLREHVCVSCLARRSGGCARLRQFYSTPSIRVSSGGDPAGDVPLQDNSSSKYASASKKTHGIKKNHISDIRPKQNSKKPSAKKSSLNAHDQDASRPQNNAESAAEKGKDSAQNKITADRKSRKKIRKVISKSQKANVSVEKYSKRSAKETPDNIPNTKESQDGSTGQIPGHADMASTQSVFEKLKTAINTKVDPKDSDAPVHLSSLMSHMENKTTGSISLDKLKLTPLDIETPEVPQLSFGLERVLFNPGVYHLRDPRSRVFNFDPYLGSIMPVTEFDFDALKEYITSSRDETLRNIAVKEKKKYVGSSSSMTSVLSHFHYLLSAWRGIDTRSVSQGFPDKLRTFTRLLRSPSAMFLRYQDGVYAIDADKEFDSANILMNLGKSMEKLLTLPKEEFERYRRSSDNKISAEEEQAIPEAYHYSTLGDFVMRSQLDAYDPRLPGTGMFDLKTRAVLPIRMDARNFEHGLGYEIKDRFGAYESYEREYFDMIRAAFLKYSLQVRIGRMDGIFVAFHNVERIFGFQYVSLPEMDLALHGQSDTALGDAEFELSVTMWNKILDKATARFPERSLRFHFETRDSHTPFMYIFAEPVTEEEIHAIQNKNKAEVEAYQNRILNLKPKNGSDDSSEVDGNKEAPSPDNNDQSSQPALETSGNPKEDLTASNEVYDSSAPPDEAFLSEIEAEEQSQSEDKRELLAMTLIVRNKVNDQLVDRPANLSSSDNWTVDYELSEIQDKKARSLYASCQKRRQKALAGRGEDDADAAANVYIRTLRAISQKGRLFRQEEDRIDKEKGIVVLNNPIN